MSPNNNIRKVSTTALSRKLGVSTNEMFSRLKESGYITRQNGAWILTEAGRDKGGVLLPSRHGEYIAWPENIDISMPAKFQQEDTEFATATNIGKTYGLSATRINFVLSELGWVKKHMKGWVLTEQGKQQGGTQVEDYRSGVPYVRWPGDIAEAKILKETIHNIKGITEEPGTDKETAQTRIEDSFRDKFKATHRSTDGHLVRSKAEMLIDNWLYMAEIVHAYERKLPVEEEVYCDFYIPTGKVYIEYWGLENNHGYLARKKTKKMIYEKYGFNLIELNDSEVQNLDDILPRLLLKHGVQSY